MQKNNSNPETVSISFDDLFGSTPDNISLDKLENVLDSVVTDTFRSAGQDENELVRVVENGSIRWLPFEEAETLLKEKDENSDQSLQKSIQTAIRGDSRVLAQEMRVLVTLAYGTLNKYRENRAIPETEIQRTEPLIMRVGRQSLFILDQLFDIEKRIKSIRQQNPILKTFEKRVADLLKLQKQGEQEQALIVAKEIAGMKSKYVRLTRGLASDTQEAMGFRLQIQQQKKSILSHQRYLAAQREGALHEEIQDSRKTIENLKYVLAKSSAEEKNRYQENLQNEETHVQRSENELSKVQKEQAVLEKQEQETDQVISHVQKTIDAEGKSAEKKPPPPAEPKPEPVKEELPTEEKKTPRRRMHVINRRAK